MPDNIPENTKSVNDLYRSESEKLLSVWEREVTNGESYLNPSGEGINYTRFLNDIGEYSREEVFAITNYIAGRLTSDGLGQRDDIANSEYSDKDVLSMIDRMQRLNIDENLGEVSNYALSRPFIISTFNVLRQIPYIILYSKFGKDSENILKLNLEQLIAKSEIEVFWRSEAISRENSLLYKTNEGFERRYGSNPNPSGKVTEKEMARVVLPHVVRILRVINRNSTVFK